MLIATLGVDHAWFTFNVRDDLLRGLKIGQPLEICVRALGEDSALIPATTTAINVEGSCANWRATRASGDFSLRTFSVRTQPDREIQGLRPGMSALVDWHTISKNLE